MIKELFKKTTNRMQNDFKYFHRLYNPLSYWYRSCSRMYKKFKVNERFYKILNEDELFQTKKSDTCVIFGSGYSLNNITKEGWEHLSKFDTIGFNWFVYQNFIKLDYLLIRELLTDKQILNKKIFKEKIGQYNKEFCKHNNRDAIVIIQHEFSSVVTNSFVASMILPKESKIFKYKNVARGQFRRPSESFSEGLVHGPASLIDVLNFSYIMGWKKIIIAGVDLYDRRYFWLGYDEVRDLTKIYGATNDDLHRTAKSVPSFIKRWKPFFENKGIQMYVLNPKSLLSEFLPVYRTN